PLASTALPHGAGGGRRRGSAGRRRSGRCAGRAKGRARPALGATDRPFRPARAGRVRSRPRTDRPHPRRGAKRTGPRTAGGSAADRGAGWIPRSRSPAPRSGPRRAAGQLRGLRRAPAEAEHEAAEELLAEHARPEVLLAADALRSLRARTELLASCCPEEGVRALTDADLREAMRELSRGRTSLDELRSAD